jgi:hypothetical protein
LAQGLAAITRHYPTAARNGRCEVTDQCHRKPSAQPRAKRWFASSFGVRKANGLLPVRPVNVRFVFEGDDSNSARFL